jgi:hypothetical protein
MSLDTYANLQSSIAAWLMRDDLTAAIPDFIALAEADMSNRLRLRAMLTTVEVDATGGDLPADCLAVKSVYRDTLGYLAFASTAEAALYNEGYRGGPAYWYSIDGNSLVVSPTQASGTVALRYYARVPALSDSNPTNAILQASPALYLYGSLLQAAPYLLDDARMQTWGTLYEAAAGSLQGADDAAEFPGPLVIRPAAD